MAVIDEKPEAIHRELRVTIPTKETIEKELTAAEMLTQDGIDAVKELDGMKELHPKHMVVAYRSTLKKFDEEQRRLGLLVHQKAREIDEALAQIRHMKMSRGILVSSMRDMTDRTKEVKAEEEAYQKEQQEMIKDSKVAPRGRGRRKS